MQALKKYSPFFISAALMYVVLVIIYPHLWYYVDPDGTSYLTISKRYAAGDYLKAINCFWSPLSCWLTAIFIKIGLAAIPASIIVNSFAALGCLFITQSFFIRFNIALRAQWIFSVTLALFLCYAVYWQSFDDIWECFLLLATLRIMLATSFKSNPALWVASGIVGAIAYFAKAYSFPFFILNTLCCVYFICKDNKLQWLKISFVAISVMALCSFPWIYAIHYKYGKWMTSSAGPLNMAWFLIGHPYWRNGIGALLPPLYSDSPYYWEDPYIANGIFPHFWDSWHLAGKEFLRVGFNVYKLVYCLLQISVFIPVIGTVAVRALWMKTKSPLINGQARILVISCLLLPLGYLIATVETRYLWYLLPPSMVLGALLIENLPANKWKNVLIIAFPLSILIYPALSMKKMYNEGINEYKIATQLKQLNIHGTFTGMPKPGIDLQRMERIAYFSGVQFYTASKTDITYSEVLREIRRYKINYYFTYDMTVPVDEQGKAFRKIDAGDIGQLNIFQVNP